VKSRLKQKRQLRCVCQALAQKNQATGQQIRQLQEEVRGLDARIEERMQHLQVRALFSKRKGRHRGVLCRRSLPPGHRTLKPTRLHSHARSYARTHATHHTLAGGAGHAEGIGDALHPRGGDGGASGADAGGGGAGDGGDGRFSQQPGFGRGRVLQGVPGAPAGLPPGQRRARAAEDDGPYAVMTPKGGWMIGD
jgi:hypothetical protein